MRTGSRRERRAGSWQTPTNRPPPMSCPLPRTILGLPNPLGRLDGVHAVRTALSAPSA